MAILPTGPQSVLSAYADAAKRVSAGKDDADSSATPNFSQFLAANIADAVDSNRASESVSIQAVSGRAGLQDVVEAVHAAEISLQTVVSLRDRVVSAYQEVMRMPI